jgi:microcystin-dependent protein
MSFFLAQIVLFAGNFAPKNFLFCSGQLLSIAQNQALFSLLGTTYGGDGVTTFALPDLRGATLVSAGQAPGRSNYGLGQIGGVENVSLTVNNLPAHTHTPGPVVVTVKANARGGEVTPLNDVPATDDTTQIYKSTTDSKAPAAAISVTANTGVSGSSTPIPIRMPCLALNYCICISGLYPSRP